MNRKIRNIIFSLCAVLSLVCSGCAANRVSLAENSMVFIELVPSKNFIIKRARVVQKDGRIFVSGSVKRKRPHITASCGHIDVAVISPQGTIVEKVSVAHTPRIIKHKGNMEAFFKAPISALPQKNSKVHISYHQPTKTGDAKISCNQ